MAGTSAADSEAGWVGFLAGEGAALVTATRRQAARVLAVHTAAHRAAGRSGWSRPRVASWEQWLATLCAAASARGDLPPVIDAAQSRMLWMHVLEGWEAGHVEGMGARALVSREATVEAAMRSWNLWLEAGFAPAALPDGGGEEAACLRAWSAEYVARLEALDLVDSALAQQRLADVVTARHLAGLEQLGLVGFLELPPARRALLERLSAAGVALGGLPAEGPVVLPAPAFQARHAADPEAELRAAAGWARARLTADPHCRIAILVPDIDVRASDLLRILDETLQPGRRFRATEALARADVSTPASPAGQDPQQADLRPSPPAYDLAFTPSLASFPAVADGLALLGFDHGPAPAARWTQLLLSPCLPGAAEEGAERVAVDDLLRRERPEPWDWHTVVRYAKAAPVLARTLEGLAALHPCEPAQRLPPSQWAARFQARLAAAGWPGPSRDPALFQTAERFVAQLEVLASLDALLPALDARDALAHLRTLLTAQRFRPRTAPCRLDVIPLEELPGMAWDAVWVTGLTAASFPQPVRPPPFLPAPLSRERHLPGSAPAQLERARRWLAALAQAAPEGVVSAPEQIGEEQHELAPLVRAWLGRPQALEAAAGGLPGIALERFHDDRAPALPPGRHRGSRNLLRDQTECPFRAWALHRAGAQSPRPPMRAVDARHRGEWLHAALAALWQAIGDSRTLADATPEQREDWLDEAVRAALLRMRRVDPALGRGRFARLEAARLRRLLGEWLAIEHARTLAFSVTAVEQEIHCRIDTLDLTLRPDRVDRLEDGRRVVIDYKTGRVSTAAWFPPLVRDPQAALYALAGAEAPVAAVLMARLDPRDTGLVGVAAGDELRAGLGLATKRLKQEPEDFTQLLDDWRAVLSGLAAAWLRGEARVAPLPRACRYCEVGPLCRIDSTVAEAAGEFDASDTSEGEDAGDAAAD